jgi:dihydropteroate synthase
MYKTNINCNGKLLDLSKPIVMGILNITPDSFYDGGNYLTIETIKTQVKKMLDDGATIIDIGAYSSRPGATHISENEEIKRLTPVLKMMLKQFPEAIVSVDTFRANIADIVTKEYGVSIINDISAGEMDKNMFETIAKINVPYIIMHMKGTPQNMQQNPVYKDVIDEIIAYFSKKVGQLKKLGVHDLILDPGFGFGKTLDHNYQLLNKLDNLAIFEYPVLAGLSRKSMIYKFLNNSPQQALNGTTVVNTLALTKGASILRVHDVKEAKEAIDLHEIMQSQNNFGEIQY